MHLDPRRVLEQAGALAPPERCAGLVVGAGFEGRRALLSRLSAGRRLFGNDARVVRMVKDPAKLFPTFDRLGIPHPETRRTRPTATAGWLVKRAGGAGGTHVGPAGLEAPQRGTYFQRHESGVPCSVLFLADGRRAFVVGFNRQWTRAVGEQRPFVYAGAISAPDLPDAVDREVRSCLDRLVAETGLVGLVGLDFLWQGDRWLALEVNPRPTATLDLHDADYPRGLFDAHLEACVGHLPDTAESGRIRRTVRAQVIMTAGAAMELPEGFEFPPWCRDIPRPGHRFAATDPVCTVMAEGPDPDTTVGLLDSRRHSLELQLARVMAGS
jgi:predicted ATP-grasp superfamily ATP-dependent carboligase